MRVDRSTDRLWVMHTVRGLDVPSSFPIYDNASFLHFLSLNYTLSGVHPIFLGLQIVSTIILWSAFSFLQAPLGRLGGILPPIHYSRVLRM
jgi:hypothetical protein